MDLNAIGTDIVGAAIKVHSALGPGLLESAYQACLAYELRQKGRQVDCEISLPISYGEIHIDSGYRIDMLIDNSVIVENKAVDKIIAVHEAQLLTYMKLRSCRLGYLLNWNVPLIKDGVKRFALNL